MGFEYDLAKAFTNYLGATLTVRTPKWEGMIEELNKGKGDFIAASMTITPSREEEIDFSHGYLSIQQKVILHKDNRKIKKLKDLRGKTIHVRKGTSYEERLRELKEEGLDLKIKLYDDMPTEELIRRVADKEIEITIADSNISLLNRRYYPDIRIAFPIEEPQSLGWAVKKGEKELLNKINDFFETTKANGTFSKIYRKYYANVKIFDHFDLKKYHQRLKTKLPKYEAIIKKAAGTYGFDWRLIAAVTYQESHFDPRARSFTGARGMMQLTLTTAKEMGVTDRLDPEQNIMGGAKYLKKLYQRYDKAKGLDRMLIALASYNVGPRHVVDAQEIAREKGLDPHKWSSLELTLPLLRCGKYYKKSKYGYCRGTVAVRYVNRILTYYDILKREAIGFLRSQHPA
jgi:membrane-bound lytic murein transglycosylase F